MSGLAQFRLPDLGEGLTECDIIRWLVKPGDVVRVNQPIVEVETAKAAVEVPSPYAGTIVTLHYAAGDTAEVGSPLVDFNVAVDAPKQAAPTSPEVGKAAMSRAFNTAPHAPDHHESPDEVSNSILVGYGPKASSPKRRARKNNAPAQTAVSDGSPITDRIALAKPPVRRFAKDLGIDLRTVSGSGPSGTITRDDVAAAAHPAESPISPAKFSQGDIRVPVKGVRKHTAAAVTSSAFTAPHVTEFISVDMTALLEMRDQIGALPEFA